MFIGQNRKNFFSKTLNSSAFDLGIDFFVLKIIHATTFFNSLEMTWMII